MTLRPIQFIFRGLPVTVDARPIDTTLLQWLRDEARATGTKEGCAEGDCGACTVLVARMPSNHSSPARLVGPAGAQLEIKTINSCIALLPTLDGKAVFTVEDLKRFAGGQLHPVQQAMVDCHGSQCGFCTPGFVMSLTHLYETHQQAGTTPTRQQVADGLAGNLCRCTGYRPILDAGVAAFGAPAVRLPIAQTRAALQRLPRDEVFQCVDSSHTFFAPSTLEALARVRLEKPSARLLAGSTDVGLWVTKQHRVLGDVLSLTAVDELRRVAVEGSELCIGAAVSLEDGYAALTTRWPMLSEYWLRFASPPIRHAGTLVGNIANGSPIGDTAPVLMALGASVVLRRGAAERTLPLESLYNGYMQNVLQPGEFIAWVRVPLGSDGARFRAAKVSKRFDSDISAVSAGLLVEVDSGRVREARFAFGGMAATVKRAGAAESAVKGQPWSEETVRAAMAALANDFTPLSDQRASDLYRRTVAKNVLFRFWLETRDVAPLSPESVSVFAREVR